MAAQGPARRRLFRFIGSQTHCLIRARRHSVGILRGGHSGSIRRGSGNCCVLRDRQIFPDRASRGQRRQFGVVRRHSRRIISRRVAFHRHQTTLIDVGPDMLPAGGVLTSGHADDANRRRLLAAGRHRRGGDFRFHFRPDCHKYGADQHPNNADQDDARGGVRS